MDLAPGGEGDAGCLADAATIGAASDPFHQRGHDFREIPWSFSVRLPDNLRHESVQFLVRERGREVALQHGELGLFPLSEIRTVARAVLLDGVGELLGLPPKHGRRRLR